MPQGKKKESEPAIPSELRPVPGNYAFDLARTLDSVVLLRAR